MNLFFGNGIISAQIYRTLMQVLPYLDAEKDVIYRTLMQVLPYLDAGFTVP